MKKIGTPRIEAVKPPAALPGGEVSIQGSGFGTRNHTRPQVQFGLAEGSLVLAAENLLIARVPEGAAGGAVRVRMGSKINGFMRWRPLTNDLSSRAQRGICSSQLCLVVEAAQMEKQF